MEAKTIEATFAGADIVVGVEPNPLDETGRLVSFRFGPLPVIPLYSDEARRLATVLLEAAAASEHPDPNWP